MHKDSSAYEAFNWDFNKRLLGNNFKKNSKFNAEGTCHKQELTYKTEAITHKTAHVSDTILTNSYTIRVLN